MPNLHLIYLRVNEFQNKCYKVLLNKPKLLYDIIIILYIIFVSKKLFNCVLLVYIYINKPQVAGFVVGCNFTLPESLTGECTAAGWRKRNLESVKRKHFFCILHPC